MSNFFFSDRFFTFWIRIRMTTYSMRIQITALLFFTSSFGHVDNCLTIFFCTEQKGRFGWFDIDKVFLPYIFRYTNEKFTSVRQGCNASGSKIKKNLILGVEYDSCNKAAPAPDLKSLLFLQFLI